MPQWIAKCVVQPVGSTAEILSNVADSNSPAFQMPDFFLPLAVRRLLPVAAQYGVAEASCLTWFSHEMGSGFRLPCLIVIGGF